MTGKPVRLVLADVDGTLVTSNKELTDRTIAAVAALREAGVLFALTSGRPPRGMEMLVQPLEITTPLAAFDGGVFSRPDMTVIEQRTIADEVVPCVFEIFDDLKLDTWVYRGTDWYVRDVKAPHVDREASTVQFQPTVVDDFHDLMSGVVKVVGISDDHDAVQRAADLALQRLGHQVSAAPSQPYYVDVTNLAANKGEVVRYLSKEFKFDGAEIATIGDMPNDVLMFTDSGLSIAMGNASPEVQGAAHQVTTSNEDEGFANAVHKFILT
jgi:Cof subfamily protein (haloacid dehalogenase superfamily)